MLPTVDLIPVQKMRYSTYAPTHRQDWRRRMNRRMLGVYIAIAVVSQSLIACSYDGHYVPPPVPGAQCEAMTKSICEKIDSCLTVFEKLVLSEEECNQKALGTVCVLSSSVAYAGDCVRDAIAVDCEPLRGFLLGEDPIAGISATCNTFFATVKERVEPK